MHPFSHIVRYFVLGAVASLATGCASTSPEKALRETSSLVQSRNGYSVQWMGDFDAQKRMFDEADRLLGGQLSLDSAVQVSLLLNRDLQAEYEELGFAQADYVEAGLLQNPSLSGGYLFSVGETDHPPELSLGAVTNLLQLLTMPSRKGIASTAIEASKYRVAEKVLRTVAETKRAYFEAVSALQTMKMRQVVRDAARVAVELARKQNETGTISDLVLENEEALFAEMELALARSEAEAVSAREHLHRALGTWGKRNRFELPAKLPELPKEEASLNGLEDQAILSRFELQARKKDIEVFERALSLTKVTRWFGALEAGVAYEHKENTVRLFGPTVSVELPLFNQGQANVARLEAGLRLARHRQESTAVEIRAEVRELVQRVRTARAVVEKFQSKLVPVRQAIVRLSQEQYNAMLIGVFQLLTAKQAEISTYREFIEALRDYWSLRAELEWKTGASYRFDAKSVVSPRTQNAETKPAESHQHHHGGTHEHHAP